ncbi:hypothetical protein SDC9_00910 [bioreactor metagenome]|jgi:hypothetical protein|uniref:DUF5640 domain-containing protein n=1 Tax=bioreactor metagenome TaxID=1076179 RepID=A0A644SLB0_9ZZZZ|nr:hypothetical protein [Cloacibacterium caeni]
MKNTLKLITAFLIVLSCSRDTDNGDQFASQYFGIYTEVNPVSGRTRIDFNEGNKLTVMNNPNSNWGTPYAFKISGNSITLTTIGGQVKTIYFKQVSSTKFEIGDVNPDDMDTSNMIFQK